MGDKSVDFDEVLGIEDVDVHDETSLRWLADQVTKQSGLSARMSVLNTEQWNALVKRYLGSRYKGAAPHLHVLVDPQRPHHLLVSPSAVLGVGQMSGTITSEIVYGLLSAMGPPLPNLWKHGVHQYLATEVAKKAKIRFQHDYHPRESDLISGFVDILISEYGYSKHEWYQVIKRRPGSVFTALAKTKWTQSWIMAARSNTLILKTFKEAGYDKINRDSFIKLMTDPARHIADQFTVFTIDFMNGAIPHE